MQRFHHRQRTITVASSERGKLPTISASANGSSGAWVQDGGLPFVQDGEGTPFLFDLRDLDAYIDRHKHTGIDLFAS